jgi:hypothetical protein
LLKRMEREGMVELHRHVVQRKNMPSNQDIF